MSISSDMRKSIIWGFMDLLILKELKNHPGLGSQDLIDRFYTKFHISISLGSMHSLLYTMEKEELLRVTKNSGKRTYRLAEKGKKKVEKVLLNLDSILSFIRSVLDEKSLSKLL